MLIHVDIIAIFCMSSVHNRDAWVSGQMATWLNGYFLILLRWLSSLDARPGLNKIMLDMLERRRQEDQVKYGCVTLMLDAMSIKNHVQYDPQTQTMFGYVDMGDRLNETDMASDVLVFTVVGLQGYWKAPIAYYLTK